MATATLARLGSIDVKGGLWGADLLAALADDRSRLPTDTVTATSYQLPRRASTEQTARAAWTILTAAWEEFSETLADRAAVARSGTYGTDTFTWDKWTSHLLDQLGYDPTPTPAGGLLVDNPDPDDPSDRYAISHWHDQQVPIHALPATVELGRRTAGVPGAARQSPHSLVQDYLNRTSRHLWAIATNGLTLRLLRDNAALSRQAYIEFDLAAIFDEGNYPDFALLWHAAHATRFTHDPDATAADCIAETWQDHAAATGVAALEDLRGGVEAAIAEIGQGLIEHRDNTALRQALADPDDPFDAAAYYRELLYIAYRHVFWFALDDRNLLHPPDADRHKVATYRDHYASTVLRDKARAHLGGRHPDSWQHFHTVTRWFSQPDGCPDLDVPGLLGRLWDPASTQHLNGTTLTNRRYYEAVRRLGYVLREGVLRRINYDAMGSEELGAVYESLLEIRPTADSQNRDFTLGRTDGSDRKKTGSYYTPTSLIKILLDEALDPVVDERLKQATHDLPTAAGPDQHRQAQEQAILTTTVCDPAMGSAHFVVAAGMRLAKRLAAIRTGEIEPAPEDTQQAFRDVASRCLYGVDVNPMAVELAKLAIWLECHVPGQPLTFLDHHLKHGNALLGVGFDPDLIAWDRDASRAADQGGVPNEAFKPLAGDDKAHARSLRDRNKKRRSRGSSLRFHSAGAHHDQLDRLATSARQLTDLADDTPTALAAKQQAFADLEHDAELERQRLRADAWIASWTITKTPGVTEPLTTDDPLADDNLPWDVYYDTFFDDEPPSDDPGIQAVQQEADRLTFFHWYVEFPHIAGTGGFSLNLGNPPWERVKLQEREWFAAAGYEEIAKTKNASQRKRKIASLIDSDDAGDRQAVAHWQQDSHDAQATSEFARNGGRFPLGGVGDVNTYALFADHFVQSVASDGRVGIIVPTGLITDYTYRDFFRGLHVAEQIVSAVSFWEIRKFFIDTDHKGQFTLLTLSGSPVEPAPRFAFGVRDPARLEFFTLSPDEAATIAPSTCTAPAFTSARQAEIVKGLYARVGSTLRADDQNPWHFKFQRMFDITNDSHLLLSGKERSSECDPVYVGSMIHNFDSAFQTFDGVNYIPVDGVARHPESEFWVHRETHLARGSSDTDCLFGYRRVSRATDERTIIAALIPPGPVAYTIVLLKTTEAHQVLLQALLCSFAVDYAMRAKLTQASIPQNTLEQLPMPTPQRLLTSAPWADSLSLADWLGSRSAALSAGTGVMHEILGYETRPGTSDDTRRTWRAELDAGVFLLYGLPREEVVEVMNAFPIVARHDRQAEGLSKNDPDWRTKRLILAKYDELADHAEAGSTYESPDPPPPLPNALRLS